MSHSRYTHKIRRRSEFAWLHGHFRARYISYSFLFLHLDLHSKHGRGFVTKSIRGSAETPPSTPTATTPIRSNFVTRYSCNRDYCPKQHPYPAL